MAGYKAVSIVSEKKEYTRLIDGIKTLLNLSDKDFNTVIQKLANKEEILHTDFQFNYYGELDEMRKKYGAVEEIGLSSIVYQENREEYTYNQVIEQIEQMEQDKTLTSYTNRIGELKKVRDIECFKEYIYDNIRTGYGSNELVSQYFNLFCERKSYGDYKEFKEKEFEVIFKELLDNVFEILTKKEVYEDFMSYDENEDKFKVNNILVDKNIYFNLLNKVMNNDVLYKQFYIPNIERIKERYDTICKKNNEISKTQKEGNINTSSFSNEERQKLEEMFKCYGSEEYEEFIKGLTGDDLQNFLLFANSKVRKISEKDVEIGELMTAGELISPKKEIQKTILNDVATSLKNIQGRKSQATLMYHIINQLHLFDDGNGRTSRTMFEIFSNDKFDFDNNDSFIHNEKNEYSSNHTDFEELNNIINAQDMGKIASFFLYKSLLKSELINHIETKSIYTSESFKGGNKISDNLVNVNNSVEVKNLAYINRALCDNNELYSISGLTMLIMDKLKGYKEDGIEDNSFEYIIDITEDSADSTKRFANWTNNDYDMAIEIADSLKKAMLELIIDMFEYPEKFKYDGNINVCDLVTNYNGENNFYYIFDELYRNGQVDFNGTKTQQNIKELEKLIKEKDRQDINEESLTDVQSLGKQTINEISDVTLEDETERYEQIDLEKMLNKGTQEK